MNLPVQHLSDEAVAAFADGALTEGARARAARHVSECAECAHAVAVQREAVWALRAAPAPALPGDLLERLRAVPSTTPLSGRPIAIDSDGSAVFPAFGTAAFVEPSDGRAEMSQRRPRPYGLLTAAAAVLALGAVGGAVASTSDAGSGAPFAPATPPVQVQPAGGSVGDVIVHSGTGTAIFARAVR